MPNTLFSISPADGRYYEKTKSLQSYFSEYALIRYRVKVEIEYFISLCQLPLPQLVTISEAVFPLLRDVYQHFSEADALAVKDIEATTNHDVKAVEYFVKSQFDKLQLSEYKEFVHFGLTSQDINNTAVPMSLKDCMTEVYLPTLGELRSSLHARAMEWRDVAMLARTHGQPASPTRLGKELLVFEERLQRQVDLLTTIPFSGKFGGATGNFNAHHAAYPNIDWHKFADKFLTDVLGLSRSYPTTQIEHYDNLAALLQGLGRINTILIDLARDMWTYISMEYFKQKIKSGEVGSSAMPHKVNPIDFENAEGNLGLANAIGGHLAAKLPISRLQRDLTDSTVIRNVGLPFAHSLIAFSSLQKGLDKLIINEAKIHNELNDNWIVVAEGVQTILRREGYPKPYETLKALTRTNAKVTQQTFIDFIDSLDIADNVKQELKSITPFNYVGQL